jgi:hypothetical protein
MKKINITNVFLWMNKNAYEQSTIKRVTKQQRRLEQNCNKSDKTNESYDNQTTQPNASKEQTQYRIPASLYEQPI